MSTTPLLEVKDLHVQYRSSKRPVIGADGVDLSIEEGQIVGLAGESGSGKSTVAHAILRLLEYPARITRGEILLNGQDILSLGERQLQQIRWKEIAMVFQSAMNSLNPVTTIGAQFADIFSTHMGMRPKASRTRSEELLAMVGIPADRLDAFPHQLSGGMRQRTVIAMALALDPQLLILDEPTTALDVVVQQDIMARIKELQEELGFSILFITHDMSLMVQLSHKMAVMYAGQVVETGAATDMFDAPRHPYTHALMNAFPPLSGPRTELSGIPDAPQVEGQLLTGCPFAPRCPYVMDTCRTDPPHLTPRAAPAGVHGAGILREVSCHLDPDVSLEEVTR